MKFDKEFEESILAQTLRDTTYLKRASRLLDAHHFSTPQHAWVWAAVRSIWEEYRERATAKLIIAKAKEDFKKPEQLEVHIELVRKLYKIKPTAAVATLDQMSEFVRTVNAQLSMEQAATDLEKGKLTEVYEGLRRLTRKELKQKEYTKIDWIEGFKERQRERKYRKDHPDEFVRIPTGFKKLDSIIKGIELGELGLVLATTNKGKSIFLTNLAAAAVGRKIPTVYFSLEMPARKIAMRQDARWLKMPYDKFKDFDFTNPELRAIKKRLKVARKKWSSVLKIISFPIAKVDINVIRNALDDLWTEEKFRPQLILIDSGDHMNGVGRFESYRLEQKSVYMALSSLAEEDGYAIWSSTHAGREWADSVATAEASSESYDKSRIADIVVSLNTPKRKSRSTKVEFDVDGEEVKEATKSPKDYRAMAVGTYIELFLAKYRDGLARITIPLDAELSKIYIHEMDEK